MNHIWRPLVEQAGYSMEDLPKTWDAYYDFFKGRQLHLDDPKVRKAAIEALTYPATAYREGFVPPGAINWNDADDNNAFHAKQIVMDIERCRQEMACSGKPCRQSANLTPVPCSSTSRRSPLASTNLVCISGIQHIDLIRQYRGAGIDLLINGDRNDVETRVLFASDVMPHLA